MGSFAGAEFADWHQGCRHRPAIAGCQKPRIAGSAAKVGQAALKVERLPAVFCPAGSWVALVQRCRPPYAAAKCPARPFIFRPEPSAEENGRLAAFVMARVAIFGRRVCGSWGNRKRGQPCWVSV